MRCEVWVVRYVVHWVFDRYGTLRAYLDIDEVIEMWGGEIVGAIPMCSPSKKKGSCSGGPKCSPGVEYMVKKEMDESGASSSQEYCHYNKIAQYFNSTPIINY